MWELDNKKSWAPKNRWLRTVVLKKTLGSPLDYKEIQPINPKGNRPEYSLEGLMLKLKLQYFWPPYEKSWLIGKDPDAGKDWSQEEKEMTVDEMVGWHHWLMSLSELRDMVKDREAWHAAVHGSTKSREWTTTTSLCWHQRKTNQARPCPHVGTSSQPHPSHDKHVSPFFTLWSHSGPPWLPGLALPRDLLLRT